ncbi:MAG: SDR family NAD(P)-dependent oxidoreductase [Mesorhizobium sp.]|uniref:SDR family NAD(P)-dependent oxidoreductase n=1 Tax=Mesorhizobium sp. TaxID=1871066 RepID=UPI000FE6FAD6|nr:SDR family NAD(P)-dependent oxidoreductase [Mesorhizobium sp.]RWI57099.1 MAG: SDR family NAD(P)-dependent oxidoreductase [Mesorhizobium sp.]
MNVEGMSAIVTGAGSGLGAATARMLAGLGARVAVADINQDTVVAVSNEIGGLPVVCDVTSEEAAEAAFSEIRRAHGPARILVNCAGVAPPKKILGRDGVIGLAEFSNVIAVNLVGSYNMLRLLFRDAAAQEPLAVSGERGVVVNTASIAAFEGQIGQSAYAASKGGIVALTLPAAREGASLGVRVNTIAPGIFETPMLMNLPREAQFHLASLVPFPHRLGKPTEFASLVKCIIENPMINGETIRLDGAVRLTSR